MGLGLSEKRIYCWRHGGGGLLGGDNRVESKWARSV